MTRLIILISSVLILAFTPFTDAKSSSGGSTSDGGYSGRIQSVTTTNFSIGGRGGRHRRRSGGNPIVVHYNPGTVTLTVDGTPVHSLDYKATGMYAVVSGKVVNNVLEATTISVTTAAPARHRKSKSSQ
jgi:hypothetical protein